MDLIVYGINHKTAPVEVRERFKFTDDEIGEFCPKLASLGGIAECLVLSTCNRTEIYCVCENTTSADDIAYEVHKYKGTDKVDHAEHFASINGSEAVNHLFRVTAGLESQMVGESQILGQVKDAYALACRMKTTGSYLNKLFHMAFRMGKVARSDTNLGAGAVSISSAAVELAGHVYETLEGKSALLIGAGDTGRLVAKSLLKKGVSYISIANRSFDKAQELADLFQGRAVGFEDVAKEFFTHDVVISATSSSDYILTHEALTPFTDNISKKVVAIDIALPRDLDENMSKFENVFLYDMDDLNTVVEKNVESRQNEIPRAEKLVKEGVGEYETWLKGRKVVPTIKFLRDRFEDIRTEEISKSSKCMGCSNKKDIDYITKKIIKKILRTPIEKLINNTDCSETELEYLRDLFAGDGNEDK